ncbi:MAG TPA: methyltransferase domain-containing protein [Ktedonobacteraceae bacterium]|nr:methyltransferase domain-containing protein [Ktedonobacteraceae bacterium]
MPTDLPKEENPYILDTESATEMARLMSQDQATTMALGGVLPERQNSLEGFDSILDIGCGPGGWVLEIAQKYEKKRVVGVDISRLMIQYARAQAFTQRLNNAEFVMANALGPMPFDDNSFDLLNARFIVGFTAKNSWLPLLQECLRILRPGGVIRLTEGDLGTSTSVSYDEISMMIPRLLKAIGLSFSPDGRSIGIIPVLSRLLRQAGFKDIGKMAHVIVNAPDEPGSSMWIEDFKVTTQTVLPTLIKLGITTQTEFDELYERAMRDAMSPEFSALLYFVTMWGVKP